MKFLRLMFLCVMMFNLLQAQWVFNFDKNVNSGDIGFEGKSIKYSKGIDGHALSLNQLGKYQKLEISDINLDGSEDFTVQFWIRTHSEKAYVFLSQKEFNSKGIDEQKNPGWAIYSSNGTFAWCIGSGKRRINYERDNGEIMPVNDNKWHQLTMTYSKALTEIRLYYDGKNVACYKVGFDFSNQEPLRIGSVGLKLNYDKDYLPKIVEGAENLQMFVDIFNEFGAGKVGSEEFVDLIVDPENLYQEKIVAKGISEKKMTEEQKKSLKDIRRKLYYNPYTVYQNKNLTLLKPVANIYSLKNDKVVINKEIARKYTLDEKIYPADFNMDQLAIYKSVLSSEDVLNNFRHYREKIITSQEKTIESVTMGVWNIWHGGIHWSMEKDGWDSRNRIVEMIQKKNIDVILIQETYSNGDFIAAELGYYFATTSDWDYCYQGANISVLSRFPIKEFFVNPETEFNNVVVKLEVSETQDIYAMSNWYGMNNFENVYAFNHCRFNESDNIPVFFGGDFNAVPHTDGGKSPASVKMLENGFTDAFRSMYPDIDNNPGHSHRGGYRIDQLYFKGKGLVNKSTEVISKWPGGFPSDHYLIVSEFDLKK